MYIYIYKYIYINIYVKVHFAPTPVGPGQRAHSKSLLVTHSCSNTLFGVHRPAAHQHPAPRRAGARCRGPATIIAIISNRAHKFKMCCMPSNGLGLLVQYEQHPPVICNQFVAGVDDLVAVFENPFLCTVTRSTKVCRNIFA